MTGRRTVDAAGSASDALSRQEVLTYVLAFWVGATIDWRIPRLMPGNPVQAVPAKFHRLAAPAGYAALCTTMFAKAFGLNLPLWDQYLHFWDGLCTATWGSASTTSPAR